jgi:hypothetical protein
MAGGVSRMMKYLVVVASLAIAMFAQNEHGLSGVSPKYKVGQTLRYSLTFDGDPNFSGVTLYFNRSSTSPPDESGLVPNFAVNLTQRVGPGKFDVDGTIPDTTASGRYEMTVVQPRIAPGGVKDYDARPFHIVLEIENPTKYRFPPLKDVTPK